jgi:hypothetical protein
MSPGAMTVMYVAGAPGGRYRNSYIPHIERDILRSPGGDYITYLLFRGINICRLYRTDRDRTMALNF